MKWQVLLITLAAIFAVALGASRWKARLTCASDFRKAAAAGKWSLVFADTRIEELDGNGNTHPVSGFEKLQYLQGFDITPDFARVAWVDPSNYSQQQIKVSRRNQSQRALAVSPAPSSGSPQLSCPLFDSDGSVLYLESSSSYQSWSLKRLTWGDSKASSRAVDVTLPVLASADDCPERSADGLVFAWTGTDHQIHIAERTPDGRFGNIVSTSGADFELSPDGTWLAAISGTALERIDAKTGKHSTITSELKGVSRTVAISPDGEWVAASGSGSFGGAVWFAFRVSDGASVELNVGSGGYYYGYDNHRKSWLTRVAAAKPSAIDTQSPEEDDATPEPTASPTWQTPIPAQTWRPRPRPTRHHGVSRP